MTIPTPGPNPEPTKTKEPSEEIVHPTKKIEKREGLYDYAKSNTIDTIAYIVLIVGIILMFFQSYIGQIFVGVVVGYYFSSEIAYILRSTNEIINQHGIVKSLILGGALLAFFILSPLLFLAAAVTVGIKQLIRPEDPPIKKI
jgi:hypothetical protein